jgi:serine/threonine protein kinase
MADPGPEREPIERLAELFLARFRAGERPSLKELIAAHPKLTEEIRELSPGAIEMERAGSGGGSATGPPPREPRGGALPESLGDFRILREIGRGGMGVVYEAVQESLGRHVALKVLAPWKDTDPEMIERFQREAKAVARLHHTNIVPVFGVGEQDGYRFYAMQLIQGHGLDAVLEEMRRLRSAAVLPAAATSAQETTAAAPLAAAVARSLWTGRFSNAVQEAGAIAVAEGVDGSEAAYELGPGPFEAAPAGPGPSSGALHWTSQPSGSRTRTIARIGSQVADALAYAHAQGIVHRDIKPPNLLLDVAGNVWVTDFGLAKAADAEVLTESGDILGTVRYMPPERFRGESGVAGDVYGLGVTLYELLTLRPAFNERDRARLINDILKTDPPPPRSLDPTIPRDLETIVLKALAKHPADRYPSAKALADDLGRFQAGETIQARATTSAERLWRWCRRNPRAALLTAALVLVLLGGAAISSWQWWRAERNLMVALAKQVEAKEQRRQADRYAREAHRAFDEAFTRVSESKLIDVPGAQPLRKELLTSAVRYYKEFLRQRSADPEVQGDMASACFHVAIISISLEQLDQALEAIQQGVDFVEKLCRDYPDDPRWPRRLAGFSQHFHAYDSVSSNASNRLPFQPDVAVSTLTRATALWQRLARDHDDLPGFQSDLAFLHLATGTILDRAGLGPRALSSFHEARVVAEQLFRRHPDVLFYQELLTYTYPRMCGIFAAQRRFEEAEAVFRDGIGRFDKLGAGPELGVMLHDFASFLEARGRLSEAETAARRSADLLEAATRSSGPKDYRRDLASCYGTYARLSKARPAEAEKLCQRAIALREELVVAFPRVWLYQHEQAETLFQMAQVLERVKPDDAEKAYRRVVVMRELLVVKSPETDLFFEEMIECFWTLTVFLNARRPGESLGFCRETLARLSRLPAGRSAGRDSQLSVRRLVGSANRMLALQAAEHSPAEAAEAGARAVEIWKEVVRETSRAVDRENLGHAYFAMGCALRQERKFKEAQDALSNARREFQTLVDGSRGRPRYRHFLAVTYSIAGGVHDLEGEIARAEEAFRKSIGLYERLVSDFQDKEPYPRELAHTCHWCLGRLLLEQGRFKEAEAPYRRALEIRERLSGHDPSGGELYPLLRCQTGLTQLLLASGRADEAQEVGKRARDKLVELAENHPHNLRFQLEPAWFLVTCPDVRVRDHGRALVIIKKTIEADPQDQEVQLALAIALYRAGELDASIDAIGKMNPPNGWDSRPWFILAMAHWQRGDRETARRWYDKAIEWMKRDPRDEELREFRAEAERLGIATSPSP